MKIVKVETCKDCPYFKTRSPEMYGHNHYCLEGRSFDEVPSIIPDWCPLDDMPESLWDLWRMQDENKSTTRR